MRRRRRNQARPTRERVREFRWHLVHAAGCTLPECAGVQCYRDDPHPEEWSAEELDLLRRVRVPRSLRVRLAPLSAQAAAALAAGLESAKACPEGIPSPLIG